MCPLKDISPPQWEHWQWSFLGPREPLETPPHSLLGQELPFSALSAWLPGGCLPRPLSVPGPYKGPFDEKFEATGLCHLIQMRLMGVKVELYSPIFGVSSPG